MPEAKTTSIEALESIRAQVDYEIAQLIPTKGSKARAYYYNNFASRISISDNQGIGNYRLILSSASGYDTKINRETYSQDNQAGFSPKYLDKTPKQFVDDIDLSMEEEGVSGAIVDQMVTLAKENGEDSPYEQRLLDYIAPVFIRLRLLGYNREDLVS